MHTAASGSLPPHPVRLALGSRDATFSGHAMCPPFDLPRAMRGVGRADVKGFS